MKNYLQSSDQERERLYRDFKEDPEKFFNAAEMEQLKKALLKSYKERLHTMTQLIRTSQMLAKAKIRRVEN
jgi:hypothetical protein